MKLSLSWGLFVEMGQPCVPQVVAGQEAPSRRPREDLHKKVISGDLVAARLPYAILTKMVTFFRLEKVREKRRSCRL